MAYWGKRKLNYSKESGLITLGDGENTYLSPFEIKRSESTYSRNVSSRNLPALSVRPGTVEFATALTTPNGIGARNDQYAHVQDGTTWKYWNPGTSAYVNVANGLTNAVAKIMEFNTELKRYTLLFNGTEKKSWDGSAVVDLTAAPATRLITVDDYRIYALIGSVLKCSAEGSTTDWTTADDADSIPIVAMKGVGTAITSFNDIVICWSEQSMHVLYGNDPYDFYWSDPIDDGCISDASVIIHKGKLYFLDYGEFKIYTGGRPETISQKVKAYLESIDTAYKTKCVSGSHGKYLYISIPYGASATTNNLTLEYDTETGNWYPWDVGYLGFVNIGDQFYGINATDKKIYKFNTGTDDNGTAISWSFITGVINQGTLRQRKVLSNLQMLVDLPSTSTLVVSYSTTVDGNDFVTLYTFTGSASEQNTHIQVPTTALQNIDYYRLKFAGTGPCTIHYMEEEIRIKPR